MANLALPRTIPVLPSASSAFAFVNGEPGALPLVIVHTALRAGIIATGLFVAGQRTNIVRTAIVSSLAIEAFVLGWAALANARSQGVSEYPLRNPLR